MTIREALDLYPEVRDHRAGKSRDYKLLRSAVDALARGTPAACANSGRPINCVYEDVLGTLAEAYWQLTHLEGKGGGA